MRIGPEVGFGRRGRRLRPISTVLRTAGCGALLGVTLLLPHSHELSAQSGSPLEQVDALVREGRVVPARELLLDWWAEGWEAANRRDQERALWLRGRLTIEPSEAVRSYRRILVEFPGGLFADQALLRLGQLAAAQGDTTSAVRWFTILVRDHPASAVRRDAADWLAAPSVQAALERGPTRPPPPDGDRGSEPARTEPPPTPDSVEGERVGSLEPTGSHAVQLGAFSTRTGAEALADRVRSAGFEVRIVRIRGSELWRVRSGRFPDDTSARPVYDRIADAGFEVTIVSDALLEEGGG